jgi:hypothetical protein
LHVTNSADAIRDHFLGWQCRIRQIAMRQDGGRPSPGMRPRVLTADGSEVAAAMTVLLIPKESAESTAFFRFQVQRSHDPRDVYERGLAFLQADFYQQPTLFSDQLTAVLAADAAVAERLLEEAGCTLEFDQFSQRFRLPCAVEQLAPGDPAWEASIWHNRVFNPSLSDSALILGFNPNWDLASADPLPQNFR